MKPKSVVRIDSGTPGKLSSKQNQFCEQIWEIRGIARLHQITQHHVHQCFGQNQEIRGSILQTKSMLRVDSGSAENRFVKENQCSGQNQESREIFSNQIQCFGQIEIDSRNPGNRLLKQNQCASGRIRKSGKSPVKAKPKCFGQIHPHQSGNQGNRPLKQNQCFGQIQDIRKIAHVNAFKQNPHHGVIMS